jgi:3-ketosteroid 9alpha-monooxygenase subunit B
VALQFHELTVAAIVDETADSRSFVLDVPSGLRAQFNYRAGQFLTLEVPWSGFAIRRCYSLSSAPEVDPAPRITVKRVPDGRMSNWLHDNVKVGHLLRVSPPDGRFVLDPAAGPRPLTLWGGGSGITPLLSLMKSALAATTRDVKLIYANRDAGSVILRCELDQLARAHSHRVVLHYHCDADAGFLTLDAIRHHLWGRQDSDHYVCGPAPLMDLVARALENAGIPSQRKFFERFISALDPDRRAALARAQAERKPTPSSFVLELAGAAHIVPYAPGLTLLAAAQRSGLPAPSSCEDGYCGTCTAQLVKGSVHMRSSPALTATELAAGKILLCQSVPTSAEPLAVVCPLDLPHAQSATETRPPQPLISRVLASLLVALIFAMFFLFRSRP